MTNESTIGPNPRGIDLGGETDGKPPFLQDPSALNVGFIRHLIEVSVQSFGDPMREITNAEVGSIMAEAVKRAGSTHVIRAQLVPQIVGSVVELIINDLDDEFGRDLDLIRIKDQVFVPETFEIEETDTVLLARAALALATCFEEDYHPDEGDPDPYAVYLLLRSRLSSGREQGVLRRIAARLVIDDGDPRDIVFNLAAMVGAFEAGKCTKVQLADNVISLIEIATAEGDMPIEDAKA